METDLDRIGDVARRLPGEVYYVGGCLRDCLLGLPVKDVDLAVSGPVWPAARELARALGGSPFWLREEEEVARVVLRGGRVASVDLTRLVGSVVDDLAARDLTVNAMAVSALHPLAPGSPLIDPTGGLEDLRRRLVRFTSPGAVRRDPLRALRALRFRWQLGFRLAPGTGRLVRAGMALLDRVSMERVRDELFQLLEKPAAAYAVGDALRLGLAPTIFPDGGAGVGEMLPRAAQRALRRLDSVMEVASRRCPESGLEAHLAAELTPPRSRRALLRWTLLQAVGRMEGEAEAGGGEKELFTALGEREGPVDRAGEALRLSSKERETARRSMSGAGVTFRLLEQWPATGSRRLELFHAAGAAAPEAVLLAALPAGFRAPAAALLAEGLARLAMPPAPLLDGRAVMELLGLPPGPEVGVILAALERAAADGEFGSESEAREWVLKHFGSGAEME